MHLMQFIGLRRVMPQQLRNALRGPWGKLLAWEHYWHERRFYSQFIQPGSLVFDVGANTGLKTAAFLSLGVHVVAVEPNPLCIDLIRKRCERAVQSGRLSLEALAVASRVGQLNLTIFESNHELSSGSPEFVRYARTVSTARVREVMVPSVTLDDLIAQYGLPDFIKVDVEGMDAEALRGLTQRPRFLSFEYHTAAPVWKNTRECFDQVMRLGFTEANFTAMATPKLLYRSWIGIDRALMEIEKWHETGEYWGDVIVR